MSSNLAEHPFPTDPEVKTDALERLMQELEQGRNSGDGIPESEVYRLFGVDML